MRLRIAYLVCYDLRHSLMADRGVEFVENGIDDDKIKRLGIIAPNMNVYYKMEVLWPELLFVVIVLNDFIWYYAKIRSKSSCSPFTEWRSLWDPAISHVRMFQSAVTKCLKGVLSEASYAQAKQMLDQRLLNTFRGWIANPMYWRRTHRILRSYSRYDLAAPDGAGAMVDHLCGALNVPITPAQRAHEANWIVSQRIDPQHP